MGCSAHGEDVVGVMAECVGVSLCFLAYVASVVKVRHAGTAIRDRVQKRAGLYPVVALVAYGPNCFKGLSRHSPFQTQKYLHLFALTAYQLNGLMNTVVYALQSRYVKRMRARSAGQHIQTGRQGASGSLLWYSCFNVGFLDTPSIADVSEGQSSAAQATSAGASPAPDHDMTLTLVLGCFDDSASSTSSHSCTSSDAPVATERERSQGVARLDF